MVPGTLIRCPQTHHSEILSCAFVRLPWFYRWLCQLHRSHRPTWTTWRKGLRLSAGGTLLDRRRADCFVGATWVILLMVQKSQATSWGNGSLSHYLQGFIHPGWCRISSIKSRWNSLSWNNLPIPYVGRWSVFAYMEGWFLWFSCREIYRTWTLWAYKDKVKCGIYSLFLKHVDRHLWANLASNAINISHDPWCPDFLSSKE